MSAWTTDRANSLIITSLGISGALVLVKAAAASEMPPARTWIGFTFAGLALATLATSTPQIAGPLAGLVLLSSAVVYGGPAWQAISDAMTPNYGANVYRQKRPRPVN
ncbi:hypothetical protein ACFV4G_39675 [Kitasatospora sp. NPDC059747]|uniref:hypothetical protein n=1 Tax=Kitasatospora sp. NPDC059747 TaxID=3346930 RepID=UPI00364CE645